MEHHDEIAIGLNRVRQGKVRLTPFHSSAVLDP